MKEIEDNKAIVLWGIKDVQNYFGFGRNKALSLMSLKTFPSIKIGRTYFVDEQEVYNWLRKNVRNEISLYPYCFSNVYTRYALFSCKEIGLILQGGSCKR